jgi:GPH family glycoside/pentoside/hexuronide:cation symporter
MLLALFLFDTLYTAIATSVYIMPYEMAISNRARSSIFLWKILFSVFWVAVPLVLERTIKPDISDQAGLALFRLVMIVLGIGMGVVIYLSSFYYREKHFTRDQEQFPFFKSLKECFSNRALLFSRPSASQAFLPRPL